MVVTQCQQFGSAVVMRGELASIIGSSLASSLDTAIVLTYLATYMVHHYL